MAGNDNASQPADGLLDMRQFKSMSDALGHSFTSILTEFFDSCESFCTRLEEALLTGGPELREVCHEIKGSAGLIGLSGIANTAAGWENAAAASLPMPVADPAEKLRELIGETRRAIEKLGS